MCLEHQYSFITHSQMSECADRRVILLRHDVDHSLDAAAEMAERERRLGVRASYYLLLHGDYDLLTREGTASLQAIRVAGHEIGLHYDVALYDEHELSLSEGIERDLALLQAIAGVPVCSFSPHNPTTTRLIDHAEYSGFEDVHMEGRKWGFRYLSDSCQAWREGCLCGHIAEHSRLHVLIHPLWWRQRHTNLFEILRLQQDEEQRRVETRYARSTDHYRECLSVRASSSSGRDS